ncbi:uncharacterized protein Z520_01017 [Fonsecaea multimorphosa CBS 102226]|uniref:Zn(2)-C6 fungal-type domain-containing protein n=1 Tax=Fonsecaea multimorphosa CBS 102226 TaxID=1442371 RepID=A0A0D2IZP4_9EURO|nr:uncharacterized protein Z520_01017 [Fonsecaea multimorphosa CBS 102226]KIY02552.1 hypothetical protein Z520_01017 [Fonsecaea multimorphosa CBS 102226]OAL31418.1 hypothetical protein AYO22_01010 [Fonsecaea multimorphosa]
MKPGNTTSGLSPPSTASPGGVTKSTSLPISRSTNSAWEKPERARTSHACEPCRERKTKCDGSRPACRRCLHTGTTCYYGYGKGWRKRKLLTASPHASRTAEDLTATSRRLARYESLLNEIIPMVSPEVRALIEDARDNDTGASNNGSETAETEQNLLPPALLKVESTMSGSGGRIILPLPVPSPHVPAASRSSTSSGTFDSVVPPPTIASTGPGSTVQTSSRLSPESNNSGTRLPSITAEGLLIETGLRDRSPTSLHPVGSYGQDRLGAPPTSPTSHTSLGGALTTPHPGPSDTDPRRRDYSVPTVFPWLKSNEAAAVRN